MRTPEPPNDLAPTLRDLMRARGLTHKTLLARCGEALTASYLSQLLHDKVGTPNDERLRSLAAALGVPFEALDAATHRPRRVPVGVDLPPELLAGFSRADRVMPDDELARLYRHIADEVDMVSRPYVEAERGPTHYLPEPEPPDDSPD